MEFARFGGELLAGDIHTEIVHAEAVRRQQRSDQNLANFVDVALGRAQHHDASHGPFRAEFPQFRIEHGHRRAHRLGGGHHVRQIHLARGELFADVVHARDVAVVDGVDGRNAGGRRPAARGSEAVSGAPSMMLCRMAEKVVVGHRGS